MKRKICIFAFAALMLLSGCGKTEEQGGAAVTTQAQTEPTTAATAEAAGAETVAEDAVGYDGMEPVYADSLKDGKYEINVDSSSSMFKITDCALEVADGKLSAVITMSGTGYEFLYLGTAEEAAAANESERINFDDNNGTYSFTVPVEALDKEIKCAAFSKKKQLWYDRTLVFRADSLPIEAFADGVINTVETLGLADGEYTVEVSLSGGSGKASVQSPTKLTVKDNAAYAEIVWSSNKYDYMVVNGEKIEPVSVDEHSVFEIPVSGFDFAMPVSADTTAMSQPYEISYTLNFDSSSIS